MSELKKAAINSCGGGSPMDGYDAFLAGASWQVEKDIALLMRTFSREPKNTAFFKIQASNVDMLRSHAEEDRQ